MRALLLVDLQYDFMPGGALGVAHGDATVPVAQALMKKFDTIIATQDWHPRDHASFAINNPGTVVGQVIDLGGLPQVMWPPHCVQGTHGAELHESIDKRRITAVFRKGLDRNIDSYSAFFDNAHRKSTGLGDWLRAKKLGRLWIMGLATDYCVKYSVHDARQLGFEVTVVADGCRAVELEPGDAERAFAAMREDGAKIVTSAEVS